MKTDIIIFSKNRTLQLKSLILSLKFFSDVSLENIHVLFKCDNDNISYAPLINQYKEIHFVEESDFLQNIKDVINHSDADFIQFMVDDLIIRAPFKYSKIEELFKSNSELDVFSPRMGKNIKVEPRPQTFIEYGSDFIGWTTSPKLSGEWNYPWDMSSSMYRKEFVLQYLKRCRHDKENYPNPFEDHFYQCMPTTKKSSSLLVNMINFFRFIFTDRGMHIFCWKESLAFVQNVNEVADIPEPGEDRYSPEFLHQKMLEGFVVDFKSLTNVLPDCHNSKEPFFKLTPVGDIE